MGRIAAVAALVALLAAACGSDAPSFSGYVRTPLPEVGTVGLPDVRSDGEIFPMRANPDGILVMYFGFTSCPDVCPTTLADVRAALRELGDDAARVSMAMATVDPGRDTADVLVSYLAAFIPDAHPLRTDDPTALRAVADAFGADYEVTVGDNGTVDVAHTANLYAVDAAGRRQLTWPFGTPADQIAADLQTLLESA